MDTCKESLEIALKRHDEDEAELARFLSANAALQSDVQKVRWQRNIAIGIASGLAVGVIATGVIIWRTSE